MKIDDKNRDEKLQYDINRKIANISALSSGKIDKYEYLTGKEILPSDQSRTIKHDKFLYFPLGKMFEKKRGKQIDPLKSLNLSNKTDEFKQIKGIFPKKLLNDLSRYKLQKNILNYKVLLNKMN